MIDNLNSMSDKYTTSLLLYSATDAMEWQDVRSTYRIMDTQIEVWTRT